MFVILLTVLCAACRVFGSRDIQVSPPVFSPRCGLQHDMAAIHLQATVDISGVTVEQDSYVQFLYKVNNRPNWNMLCQVNVDGEVRGRVNRLGCYNYNVSRERLIVHLNQLARVMLSEAKVTMKYFKHDRYKEDKFYKPLEGNIVTLPFIYNEIEVTLHTENDTERKTKTVLLEASHANMMDLSDFMTHDDFEESPDKPPTGGYQITSNEFWYIFVTIRNLRQPFEIYYKVHGKRRGTVRSPNTTMAVLITPEDLEVHHEHHEPWSIYNLFRYQPKHEHKDKHLHVNVYFTDSACQRNEAYDIRITADEESVGVVHRPSMGLLIGCFVCCVITNFLIMNYYESCCKRHRIHIRLH